MSILSTVKKGYLYMNTVSGYIKLLPRTLASLVSLDNGNSVETEISNIKSAASSLSSTVSGHTTTLNSHGSSISAIKTKTDALKNAANKTVANNLTTTADGYVLDARMGKNLQDSITTLNSTFVCGHLDTKLTNSKQVHTFHVTFKNQFIKLPRIICTPIYGKLEYIRPLTFSVDNITSTGFDLHICSDNNQSNNCNVEFYWFAMDSANSAM